MNNPIDMALTKTVHSIPPQILDVAMRTANRRWKESNHIASFICQHIIQDRVYKDCNLSAGMVKTIALRNEWIETGYMEHGGYAGDDGPYTLYRIPAQFRDNMPITNVLSIQYPYNTYLGGGIGDMALGSGGFNLVEQLDQVLNSYTLATPRNHPTVRLMSGDLVKLTPSQYANQNWLLTVMINYDPQFTNLHNSAVPVFQNLVMLATKQWCYNNLYIDVDRAYMETGVDIGAFKTVLETYADAGQLYDEELLKWRGVGNMDPTRRARLLQFML